MINRFLYWIVDHAVGYRPPRQRKAIKTVMGGRMRCHCGDREKDDPWNHFADEHGRWPS